MKEFLVGLALVICVIVTGEMDRRSEEVTKKIIAESPRPIISYTITQDSPGLDGEQPMFPLTSPVSLDTRAAKNERRSAMEGR